MLQHHEDEVEEVEEVETRKGTTKAKLQFTAMENRRPAPPVKPAKMNIPEFSGVDADSWIQTIETYFDAARTPLDQRTEVAVTDRKSVV